MRRRLGSTLLLTLLLGACSEAPPPGDLHFRFERIATPRAPNDVTDLVFLPGSGEFLLSSMNGWVGHFRLSGPNRARGQMLGEFTIPGQAYGAQCAVSLALDPDFDANRLVYASHCISDQSGRITRLRLGPDYAGVAASAATIYEVGHPEATLPFHNIGTIGFDPEGSLWALVGEKHMFQPAASLESDLGSLIRIVPEREGAGGHAPDPRNPWVGREGASPNLLAKGLRSPWTGLLDSRGFYWIGDVGDHSFEEINLLTRPGQNFGWPAWEGPCQESCEGLTDPILALSHDSPGRYGAEDPAEAGPPRSVYVAVEYPELESDPYAGRLGGAIVIGDFYAGWIRELRVDATGALVADRHLAHLPAATSWAVGPDGYLYVTRLGRPALTRAVPFDG
jgi:glucose/arabinose dehydrogenase